MVSSAKSHLDAKSYINQHCFGETEETLPNFVSEIRQSFAHDTIKSQGGYLKLKLLWKG